QKTPDAFRKACKRFIFVENLRAEAPQEQPDQSGPKAKALTEARKLVLKAFESIEAEEDWVNLGQLGQVITAANPDFDTRSYGQKKLSDLIQALKVFEVKRGQSNQTLVKRRD
ncbi:MAG: OST-HTH/LOTUS domain-containing protein, partial [Pseudomonadota bacterium]